MTEVNAVQIPAYNKSDPALWFIMCESTFALATPKPTTESITKYNYIVSHIPPDIASLVRDILIKPDATDPYGPYPYGPYSCHYETHLLKICLAMYEKTNKNMDVRFSHIHIDIVGPLPPSDGFQYLLTMIDRFSRWPEAVPIPDTTAKTISRAIFHHWIARFGCPSLITTDQGSQMRSSLFAEFTRILGTDRVKTTAYHPISNGLVERFHRHLKASIKAHESSRWTSDSFVRNKISCQGRLESLVC
ncbi:retrovirus-related Pol polyprotein from transposon 412 [Trichonephila clavipes]|nr:retrovirus-related Pol polyprotein from transposon 412 [Trichonephila clavipes]